MGDFIFVIRSAAAASGCSCLDTHTHTHTYTHHTPTHTQNRKRQRTIVHGPQHTPADDGLNITLLERFADIFHAPPPPPTRHSITRAARYDCRCTYVYPNIQDDFFTDRVSSPKIKCSDRLFIQI